MFVKNLDFDGRHACSSVLNGFGQICGRADVARQIRKTSGDRHGLCRHNAFVQPLQKLVGDQVIDPEDALGADAVIVFRLERDTGRERIEDGSGEKTCGRFAARLRGEPFLNGVGLGFRPRERAGGLGCAFGEHFAGEVLFLAKTENGKTVGKGFRFAEEERAAGLGVEGAAFDHACESASANFIKCSGGRRQTRLAAVQKDAGDEEGARGFIGRGRRDGGGKKSKSGSHACFLKTAGWP